MKRYLLIAGLQILLLNTKAQTSIYSENFEGSTSVLPTGWVSLPATNGWEITTTNNSANYTGVSGANNIKIDNNSPTGTYSIITKSIATTGYSSITVSWGARFTNNFGPSNISPSVYYSVNNGTSWASASYTEASSGSVWALDGPVLIPSAADNQASVQFMLVANITNNASGTYRIDDFLVKGTAMTTTVVTSISENTFTENLNFHVSNKVLNYTLSNETNVPSTITLLDLAGKEIFVKTISPDQKNDKINLDAFTNGIYVLRVESKNSPAVSKKVVLFN